MLSEQERSALRVCGNLWGQVCEIVGQGPTRESDLNEIMVHVHAIQRAIMAQSAAREHPGEFRLLGEMLPPRGSTTVEFRAVTSTVVNNWAAVRDALTAEIVQEFGLNPDPG